MAYRVSDLHAREILDSRGHPTLEVALTLDDGALGIAGVPSGASTGKREAVELRDGDRDRYGGAGVQRAVMKVEGEIREALVGRSFDALAAIDAVLVRLDGNADKSRLGANSTTGVSMAAARAMAESDGTPLYRWLAPDGVTPRLPVPNFNVINGGAHAQNALDFQEFMIAPLGAPSFREALRAGSEIYAALRAALHDARMGTGLGDEGGFAPELATPEAALALLVDAISAAGYEPDRGGVALALDPAASGFYTAADTYVVGDETLTSARLVERYAEMVERYPIWSIEDGLAEDDWEGWRLLTDRLGDRVQLVGDDLVVTNPEIIDEAIRQGVANAVLIKVNQIGTVSETLDAIGRCRAGGYAQMVSHRSGETTDPFIADLAVAVGCGQIKSGAPARGERVAKYNRLAGIELELPEPVYGLPPRGDGSRLPGSANR
jgi:enolase